MNLYVDSSALLRRYLIRPGGPEFEDLLCGASVVATAALTRVEVAAVIVRYSMNGGITKRAGLDALEQLEDDCSRMIERGIGKETIAAAYTVALSGSLKGYDAVHLAVALLWRDSLCGAPVTVATFDELMWKAAHLSGFDVWPPDLSLFKS